MQRRLSTRVAGANATISTRGGGDVPQARTVVPWLRTWGDFADITPNRSTSGVSWDTNSWGLQAGIDVPVGDHAAGDLVAGLSLRYASISASMMNAVGSGQVDAEGFGLGASLTWSGQNGAYVDLQGAVDWVSSDARSSGAGVLLEGHDDVIYSASAEFGHRYAMENGVTFVPQIQLSWGMLRDESLVDGLGNAITFKDRESLIGRAGLAVEQSVTDSAFGSGTIYGFGNLLHDFASDRVVSVSGTDLVQSGTGTWAEIGGGFSLTSSEAVNLFAQASVVSRSWWKFEGGVISG